MAACMSINIIFWTATILLYCCKCQRPTRHPKTAQRSVILCEWMLDFREDAVPTVCMPNDLKTDTVQLLPVLVAAFSFVSFEEYYRNFVWLYTIIIIVNNDSLPLFYLNVVTCTTGNTHDHTVCAQPHHQSVARWCFEPTSTGSLLASWQWTSLTISSGLMLLSFTNKVSLRNLGYRQIK